MNQLSGTILHGIRIRREIRFEHSLLSNFASLDFLENCRSEPLNLTMDFTSL